MDKRYTLRPRLLARALTLTISLAACGGASPVTLRYITPGGPDNCYLPAFDGELVSDPTAVTVFINQYGQRWSVLWPAGWTGRSSGSEVEVLDPRGAVVARTGTSFYPSGGLDADGNWEMCDLVDLPPAG
jgi:hypothetical protein